MVPSLEEIFDEVPPRTTLNLDLKCRRAGRRRYAGALLGAIERRSNLVLSSFNWPLLLEVRRRTGSCRVMPAVHRRFAAAFTVAERLGAEAIAAHHRFLRGRVFREAARRKLSVFVFTVNDPREARRLLHLGAAGFYTNFPGRLRRELSAHHQW